MKGKAFTTLRDSGGNFVFVEVRVIPLLFFCVIFFVVW